MPVEVLIISRAEAYATLRYPSSLGRAFDLSYSRRVIFLLTPDTANLVVSVTFQVFKQNSETKLFYQHWGLGGV